MNNIDVYDYYTAHGDAYGHDDSIAESMKAKGYGQTVSGSNHYPYPNPVHYRHGDRTMMSEFEHFTVCYLQYLGNKDQRYWHQNADYRHIRCPQLVMFIAETAGLNHGRCLEAYHLIQAYENNAGIRDTEKNANYLYGKPTWHAYTGILRFDDINDIISDAGNWDEVMSRVSSW